MKFVMMADLLIVLFANGIRFYAIKRYIDFFVSEDQYSWKNQWILYILACVVTFAVGIVFVSPGLNVIVNILALLMLVFPYRIKMSKKLLMIFAIYAINALVDIIVVQLLAGYVPGQRVEAVYHLVISLLLLIPTALLQNDKARNREVSLPFMNVFILGMIPMISIVCIHCIAVLAENDQSIVLTTAFSLMLINAFLFYLYYILTKFYAARMNEKRLEQLVNAYAYQIDVMRESQEQMKKLQHDIKHHMIELSAMAQQDQNGDMLTYLEQMQRFMLNPAEKVSTGNEEIDGVLNYMLRRAEELLDIVEIDIRIPKRLYSKNFNVCVILGNLMDNAVREAEKSVEKYLSISMRMSKDVLIILIENSYEGKISWEDGQLKTDQEDLSIHGIGLKNVKQIVASCGGDIKIDYTEKRFMVQVLLYLSNVI